MLSGFGLNGLGLGSSLSLDREICRVPHLVVEGIVRAGGLGLQAVEKVNNFINALLTNTSTVSASDVHHAIANFFLTSHEDVVPLIQLGVSDLLVELGIRFVKFDFEASVVKVEHDTVAVVKILL